MEAQAAVNFICFQVTYLDLGFFKPLLLHSISNDQRIAIKLSF